MVKRPQENLVGRREVTSMNNPTKKGHIDQREVGGVHLVITQAIIDHGSKTTEEVQLAIDQPHTNDRHQTRVMLADVIPRTGVMGTKGEVIPAIRAGGKSQSLYQRVKTLKREIQGMQHQWPRPWNL